MKFILEDKSQTNIVMTTNPTRFTINGVEFLGTGGENVKDIMSYAKVDSELDALDLSLNINHIAPTCPDTLRCVPLDKIDPLII